MEEQPDFQNIRLAVPVQDPAPKPRARQVKKETYIDYSGNAAKESGEEQKSLAGYLTCFQCKDIGREQHMFFSDEGPVCPACYNPYIHKIGSKQFYAMLPGVIAFPFRGNNIVMLVMGSLFFGILTFFFRMSSIATGAVGAVGGGFLTEYLMSIIIATADGSDDLPDWPDFSVGAVCSAALKFFLAWFLPVLPGVLFYFFLIRTGCGGFFEDVALILAAPTFNGVLFILLVFSGIFIIPAGTAAISMGTSFAHSLLQLNPLFLFSVIARAPIAYCVVCAFVFGVNFLNVTVMVICTIIGGAWIGSVIMVPFSLYFMFVIMRMLGLYWRFAGKQLEAGKLPYKKKTLPPAEIG
jgi:hypothetical protein